MTRRITTHSATNFENEELLVLVCYEEGVTKQAIKKENPFSKTHEILVKNGNKFEFIQKNA
jgi:hypothetical protein